MKTLNDLWQSKRDWLIVPILFLLAFSLYLRTLAPSIAFLFDDTLEYQYVIPRLGIIHPTGYPFFTLLGKLFTILVPLNDPAFRLNLLSAINGALAVAMVYLVARHLTQYRAAAILAALIFAVGETFWAQAVIAESYTTQMLIVAVVLFLTLTWREEFERGDATVARNRFYMLAFAMGLGLTHHRLILLLYPAIALYVFIINRSILRDYKTLVRAFLFFLLPLLFYLYLPLRGNVGSADGTYENTLSGFIAWILAQQYTVFLTSNPLAVQHDAPYYWSLFQSQFTLVGLALAAIGILGLLRRPREWMLLVVALVCEAGFAFNYNTANVYVHFLTTFLLLALFIGAGVDTIFHLTSNIQRPISIFILHPSSFILLLLIPAFLLLNNYQTNNLSDHWDIYDYGRDILNQPIENNATIIGIGGEMTLIRYFQENLGLRTDLQTIIGDEDPARLAAIDNAVKQNRTVYTTRQLKGLAEKYSLSSQGPLVRVLSKPSRNAPKMSHLTDEAFGVIQLIGYDVDTSRLNAIPNQWHSENGRMARVTLYWRVDDPMDTDAMVSIKLVRDDQRVVGQIDHRPVNDAYPTTAWRKGEVIIDTYDVPIFFGASPSNYTVSVTMYDRDSGAVIGQKNLDGIKLDADVQVPRIEVWNIMHPTDIDFSIMSLEGYSLDLDATRMTMRAGDALPLTLLWRAGQNKLPDDLLLRIWLEDASGKTVTSRDNVISVGYPPFQWQPNSYVRDWSSVRLPANVANGKYHVKLAVARNNQMLGSSLVPFVPTIVDLGQIEIKNRPHEMQLPAAKVGLEATFDNKMRLLGYDVIPNFQQHTVEVTLWWKSLALMDTPYSVFVHVLDGENQVRSAADSEPGNGALPTTGWIENEYLVDVHTLSLIDLPKGVYRIEIGVYDPTTGARLKMLDGQDHIILRTVDVP